ncbi:hypothetical protein Bbelb_026690 [Branchiostoma belcheri]|nr:hypothetical protein Bbelb_026690 [Branchiostoma belcheri]
MYEQAQPVRIPRSGPGNRQTSGPPSQTPPVHQSGSRGRVRNGNGASDKLQEDQETPLHTYESLKHHATLRPHGGASDRRGLFSFIHSHRSCLAAGIAVLLSLVSMISPDTARDLCIQVLFTLGTISLWEEACLVFLVALSRQSVGKSDVDKEQFMMEVSDVAMTGAAFASCMTKEGVEYIEEGDDSAIVGNQAGYFRGLLASSQPLESPPHSDKAVLAGTTNLPDPLDLPEKGVALGRWGRLDLPEKGVALGRWGRLDLPEKGVALGRWGRLDLPEKGVALGRWGRLDLPEKGVALGRWGRLDLPEKGVALGRWGRLDLPERGVALDRWGRLDLPEKGVALDRWGRLDLPEKGVALGRWGRLDLPEKGVALDRWGRLDLPEKGVALGRWGRLDLPEKGVALGRWGRLDLPERGMALGRWGRLDLPEKGVALDRWGRLDLPEKGVALGRWGRLDLPEKGVALDRWGRLDLPEKGVALGRWCRLDLPEKGVALGRWGRLDLPEKGVALDRWGRLVRCLLGLLDLLEKREKGEPLDRWDRLVLQEKRDPLDRWGRLVLQDNKDPLDRWDRLVLPGLWALQVHQVKHFSKAAYVCRQDGGTLAMPRDAETNNFLATLQQRWELPFHWIGLRYRREIGKFEWVDGSALGEFNSWPVKKQIIPENFVLHVVQKGREWIYAADYIRTYSICQDVPRGQAEISRPL